MDYKPSYPTPNPQNPDKTLENLREVRLIQEKIKEVRQNTNTKIAVITPYRAQCKLLKTCLGDIENCEISTIDAYQGQEADILFFSFVRTTGTAIFYAEDRRLNVAISRAKNAVFLVGSRNYIQSQYRYKTLKALTELNTN
jgi:superfamily I DNA and/or RNA helicase